MRSSYQGEDEERMLKVCEAGDVFGELALLYNVPRAASVEAKTECTLLRLDRETFNHIVKVDCHYASTQRLCECSGCRGE